MSSAVPAGPLAEQLLLAQGALNEREDTAVPVQFCQQITPDSGQTRSNVLHSLQLFKMSSSISQ
jgi:hypothetical protein